MNQQRELPSRGSAAIFAFKVRALRLRRHCRNLRHPILRHSSDSLEGFDHVLAESRTPLWTETEPAEQRLQMGKVHNLRVILHAMGNPVVPAGEVFSFWRQVGHPGRRRGYVPGRQVQQGCVVPAIAGGICQLSNALYDVALKAGLEILERHGHTHQVSGSAANGRDATVAWNHIDLRFRGPQPFAIEARLTADELIVRIRAREAKRAETVPLLSASAFRRSESAANSCAVCGEESCFRHKAFDHSTAHGRTAFLVDQLWPEHQAYVMEAAEPDDLLCQPIDGARFRLPRYAWQKPPGRRICAPGPTLRRSLESRRLAQQGAERRMAELRFSQELAESYAARLPFDATHLVVYQNLLPFLWLGGALGGRTFDVLMQRLPMRELQDALDREHERCPDRTLLADFRASDRLVAAEAEALRAARRIITPHSQIADLFAEKAVLLPWSVPKAQTAKPGRRVVFPGPTIARKGAYELREAARRLDLELVVLGSQLEGSEFWNGVKSVPPGDDWLEGAAVVVQPAVVEEQPRRLLAALARRVPVIATPACGLGGREGVTTVPVGDADALTEAIRVCLTSQA